MNYKALFDMRNDGRTADSLESAIQAMKDGGAAQLECVKVVIASLGLSLAEADEIILHSKAWRDERDGVLDFRKRVFTLAERLNKIDNRDN